MEKISVLIIAHNEENYISKCLDSLICQTKRPDEVVLIVHNSSDRTLSLAEEYKDVKIFPFNGPEGIVNARLEGLKHVFGDIILCIDGDSCAEANWVENMVETLKEGNILVGSWVKLKGTLFGLLSSFFNKYLCILETEEKFHWAWGPSFAFLGKDKQKVVDFWEKSVEFTKMLKLPRNPEDYWLAMFMNREGKIAITNKTHVVCNQKERTSVSAIIRGLESLNNRKIISATSNL